MDIHLLLDDTILLFSISLPPFSKRSPLPGKNLLLKEQILSLKSEPHSKAAEQKDEFILFPTHQKLFIKLMKNNGGESV